MRNRALSENIVSCWIRRCIFLFHTHRSVPSHGSLPFSIRCPVPGSCSCLNPVWGKVEFGNVMGGCVSLLGGVSTEYELIGVCDRALLAKACHVASSGNNRNHRNGYDDLKYFQAGHTIGIQRTNSTTQKGLNTCFAGSRQGMRERPLTLCFPLKRSIGSFPHSLLSASKFWGLLR